MKGANPTVCDKRLRLLGDEIVNRLPGGWHALLWARRFDEVDAHLNREQSGSPGEARGGADDAGGVNDGARGVRQAWTAGGGRGRRAHGVDLRRAARVADRGARGASAQGEVDRSEEHTPE